MTRLATPLAAIVLVLVAGLIVYQGGEGIENAGLNPFERAMPDGPRCHPFGAQPQAASCQHDIAIAGDTK